MMIGKIRNWQIAICCYVVFLNPLSAIAAEISEYTLKAAFIYNFAKFVQWPDSAFADSQSPVILCILGEDPFGSAIGTIRDKEIRQRKLMIRVCSSIEEIGSSHILFVSSSETKNLSGIIAQVRQVPILTIGDTEDFARKGGMINMIPVDNRIQFEINPDAAEKSGLKISSELLKLAKIVRSE